MELLPEFILITRIEFEYIPVCLVVFEGGGNIGSKQYPVSSSVTNGIKSFVSAINIPGLGPSKMHLWPCNLARTCDKSNRLALGIVQVSLHPDVNIIISQRLLLSLQYVTAFRCPIDVHTLLESTPPHLIAELASFVYAVHTESQRTCSVAPESTTGK